MLLVSISGPWSDAELEILGVYADGAGGQMSVLASRNMASRLRGAHLRVVLIRISSNRRARRRADASGQR